MKTWKKIFVTCGFFAMVIGFLREGITQTTTPPVVILLQEDVKYDFIAAYKRRYEALNQYIQWLTVVAPSPLCPSNVNVRGIVDDQAFQIDDRSPVQPTTTNPAHDLTLKDSPSFTFSVPFVPTSGGDCYMNLWQANKEREKLEGFINQYAD